jgi:hypothetical protein
MVYTRLRTRKGTLDDFHSIYERREESRSSAAALLSSFSKKPWRQYIRSTERHRHFCYVLKASDNYSLKSEKQSEKMIFYFIFHPL